MNSTSSETSTYRSDPVGSRALPQRVWLISAAFVLGFVVFALIIGRGEISRWHFAAAGNAIQDERYADAVKSADAGLRWSPDYSELIGLRAIARYRQKDFEGCLQDYDRMILLARKNEAVNEDDIQPIAAKANILQRLGRYQDAIAMMGQVVEFRQEQFKLRDDSESQYRYALALNNRAYMQAQAGLDVTKALDDIKRAIEISRRNDDHIMLDTLGYLQLLNGENDKALETLTFAVKIAQTVNQQQRLTIKQEMQKTVDQRPYEAELKQIDENYSIILHHRGEAYDALGQVEKAAADMEQAKRLGYNPDEGIW